ncbi:hypothetical protein IKA15_03810 [bacterium]|nr:hypothetical protein [bacterium]
MKILFGARYINSIPVLKKVEGNYKKQDIAFVELDVNDISDMTSLKKTTDRWGDESYLSVAEDCMQQSPKNVKRHLYMATAQSDSFEKLDEKKVLGAVVFDEGECQNHIELLQVEPCNLASRGDNATWKKVGGSMVRNLQAIFSNKPMTVFSAGDAIGFYRKTGFVENEANKSGLAYLWNA